MNYFVAGLIILLLVMQVLFYHLKSACRFCCFGDSLDSLSVDSKREESPLHNWLNRIAQIQNHYHLFIYSDADELIPAEKVETFAKITEGYGNHVETLKLLGSEHVQHYRKYPKVCLLAIVILTSQVVFHAFKSMVKTFIFPQEYVDAVTGFIRKVMNEKKEPTYLWKD